jgi:hypothetical protein
MTSTSTIKIVISPIDGCNVGCSYCNCPNKFVTDVMSHDTLSISDLFLFLKSFFRQLDATINKNNINLIFEFNGGEPCTLEKEKIVSYINLISKQTNENNLGNPVITILTNGHRDQDYYQYIIDNSAAIVKYVFSYHPQYFNFEDIVSKISNLVKKNDPAYLELMLNDSLTELYDSLKDTKLYDRIRLFRINDDAKWPLTMPRHIIQQYEIFAKGNVRDMNGISYLRPGNFKLRIT